MVRATPATPAGREGPAREAAVEAVEAWAAAVRAGRVTLGIQDIPGTAVTLVIAVKLAHQVFQVIQAIAVFLE